VEVDDGRMMGKPGSKFLYEVPRGRKSPKSESADGSYGTFVLACIYYFINHTTLFLSLLILIVVNTAV
jgi:hypothetical protein